MKIRIVVIIISLTLMMTFTAVLDSFDHSHTDTPEKSDVIIMLGGGDGRMEKAAELYHDEYGDFIIITPEIASVYSTSAEFALNLGIPKQAIIKESDATSTYTNATESLNIMEEKKFDSALIVTSDYHLKRSKMIFERVNNKKYNLKYIAALGSNGESWEEKTNARYLWFSEFYKLWGYRLGLYEFIDE